MGRLVDKHQTTVRERLLKGQPLWAEHVLAVEAATGISRHELRPDIYPLETPATATGGAPDPGLRPSVSGAHPSELSRKGLDMPPSAPTSTEGGTPIASSGMTSADPSRGLLADLPREGCVSGWQA